MSFGSDNPCVVEIERLRKRKVAFDGHENAIMEWERLSAIPGESSRQSYAEVVTDCIKIRKVVLTNGYIASAESVMRAHVVPLVSLCQRSYCYCGNHVSLSHSKCQIVKCRCISHAKSYPCQYGRCLLIPDLSIDACEVSGAILSRVSFKIPRLDETKKSCAASPLSASKDKQSTQHKCNVYCPIVSTKHGDVCKISGHVVEILSELREDGVTRKSKEGIYSSFAGLLASSTGTHLIAPKKLTKDSTGRYVPVRSSSWRSINVSSESDIDIIRSSILSGFKAIINRLTASKEKLSHSLVDELALSIFHYFVFAVRAKVLTTNAAVDSSIKAAKDPAGYAKHIDEISKLVAQSSGKQRSSDSLSRGLARLQTEGSMDLGNGQTGNFAPVVSVVTSLRVDQCEFDRGLSTHKSPSYSQATIKGSPLPSPLSSVSSVSMPDFKVVSPSTPSAPVSSAPVSSDSVSSTAIPPAVITRSSSAPIRGADDSGGNKQVSLRALKLSLAASSYTKQSTDKQENYSNEIYCMGVLQNIITKANGFPVYSALNDGVFFPVKKWAPMFGVQNSVVTKCSTRIKSLVENSSIPFRAPFSTASVPIPADFVAFFRAMKDVAK